VKSVTQDALELDEHLELIAVSGIPLIEPGDDLPAVIIAALRRLAAPLESNKAVVVVTSKVFSRAQGRFVDVSTVQPSPRAHEVAAVVGKDPRVVELILSESESISRSAKNVLIVRHKQGFISANAGIDESNARPRHAAPGTGPWVLLMPNDPDAAARELRARIQRELGVSVGVVITDSHGRPFRIGTVGAAIGVAAVPAVWDQRGRTDLHGRRLEITMTAFADQLAAAADLVAGQASEGRPVVLVRGLSFVPDENASARALLRPPEQDLYA
jgi:coenzyme F420-0:L-glutamate ligase/coenzyme F420-1:gamma-L-glutamate ligase